MCVCVCVCVRACVRARVCVRACVRARVCVYCTGVYNAQCQIFPDLFILQCSLIG